MKKLRKKYTPRNPFNRKTEKEQYSAFRKKHAIRYYMCGEYGGGVGHRPHYHAIIFNFKFPDRKFYKHTAKKEKLYTSKILTEMWGLGHASTGEVTYQSAAYVARYIMKKINGDLAETHYKKINEETGEIIKLKPEYNTMSRRPGIAKDWYEKFSSDVFPFDEIVLTNGKKAKTPKYYLTQLKIQNPDLYEKIKIKRKEGIENYKSDNTIDRLVVREKIQNNRLTQLIRHKDI